MTESLKLPRTNNLRLELSPRQRFLGLGLALNATIWGTALLYLITASPTYVSEWMVILPDGGERANVSLPGIGEATSQSASAFGSPSQDPRENYKHIAQSQAVQAEAADILNIDPQNFEAPHVELIENSMLMQFQFKGTNPEAIREQSLAFHQALQTQLNELRVEESAQQDKGLQASLATSRRKLLTAQKRLSQYQARSGFSSDDQIGNLSTNVEQLRKERADILAQSRESGARQTTLAANLKLSPQQATEAFSLQSDPQFQQILGEYGKTSAALVELTSRFTANHPAVIDARAKNNAAQTALTARGRSLLNKPVNLKSLERLGLNNTTSNSTAREQLFQDLVTVQVEKQGLDARAKEIDRQLANLEGRLKNLAQHKAVAGDLERDVQINEAIFSSALTLLDMGNSDMNGSYPQTQLVVGPNISKIQTKMYILLGALLGSVLASTGVGLLYLRHRQTNPQTAKLQAATSDSGYVVISQ